MYLCPLSDSSPTLVSPALTSPTTLTSPALASPACSHQLCGVLFTVSVVVLTGVLYPAAHDAGLFRDIEPLNVERCRPVGGVLGPEDIQVVGGVAYVTGDDRAWYRGPGTVATRLMDQVCVCVSVSMRQCVTASLRHCVTVSVCHYRLCLPPSSPSLSVPTNDSNTDHTRCPQPALACPGPVHRCPKAPFTATT